jgi:predicted TPR repeat methyltransferase
VDHDAEDVAGAAARLARLGRGPQERALSRAHIAALFDDYAPRFDASLVSKLDYCAPAMLRAALAACRTPFSFRRAIDLGCGTGLMAAALGDACNRVEGVDLSAGMLAAAARKDLYARLTRADILDHLAVEPAASADLVLAADVLIYVGDLGPLLRETSRTLAPSGLFGFTIQTHAAGNADRPRCVLGRDLRYAHDPADVRLLAAASGLVVRALTEASIRREAGQPVPGALVILEKPGT